MFATKKLDVLVVYSSGIARSAAEQARHFSSPFAHQLLSSEYAEAYAYLLESCRRLGLSAGFATTNDVIGPGLVRAYWVYQDQVWRSKRSRGYSQVIFDKCSPHTRALKQARELLFSSPAIVPFNGREIYQLFFDKLALYQALLDTTIPTVEVVGSDPESLKIVLNQLAITLAKQSHPEDFAPHFILKDRHGSAGNQVYLIRQDEISKIGEIVESNPTISFVLQPMLQFDQGYKHNKVRGKFEIRLIMHDEQIVQTYLRTPHNGEGLCNGHQGGDIIYTEIKSIPKKIRDHVKEITDRLPTHTSIYALDFVVSNNGNVYLLEGNTGPGLNWEASNPDDVAGTKALIRLVVRELARKVKVARSPRGVEMPREQAVIWF